MGQSRRIPYSRLASLPLTGMHDVATHQGMASVPCSRIRRPGSSQRCEERRPNTSSVGESMTARHSSCRGSHALLLEAARYYPHPEARAHAVPLRGSCFWEPEVAVASSYRRPEVARKPRPKSADLCHHPKLPQDTASRRLAAHAPEAVKPARSTRAIEIEAPLEKIAGDQWLQSLEKRIERDARLAPGSLQAAEVEIKASARPERSNSAVRPMSAVRPSSAMRPCATPAWNQSSAVRPSSAMRARRPQSATLAEGTKAHLTMQERQEPLELCIVGAGPPLPRAAFPKHKNTVRKERILSSPDGARSEEEWQTLDVPDLGSEDSEDDPGRMASTFPPSPFYSGAQKHQVSPVSSTTSLVLP